MDLFEVTVKEISGVNRKIEPIVRQRLDNLTKPKGSLGYLEEIAVRYCLSRNTSLPAITKKTIICFAADHGVAEEKVSAYPAIVTAQMVKNMLSKGAAINVLASHAGADVRIVDIGINYSFNSESGLIVKKIRNGTSNFVQGPAMSLKEAKMAIEVGIELANQVIDEGSTLLGTGEMGIANTTSASALMAVLLPSEVEKVTGRGTGIGKKQLKHKIEVIKKAISINKKSFSDPLHTLAAIGGFEIGGICGLILGAAARKVPVVVDGFISSAGALIAHKICPRIEDYIFFSHLSAETGHKLCLKYFNAKPILDLNLRLGEGTGAALAMFIIESAIKIYNQMASFESAGVSKEEKTN